MKKAFIYIFLAIILGSCIYPYDQQIQESPGDFLVLDGAIIVGGNSTVKISKVAPLSFDLSPHERMQDGTAWIEDDKGGVYESSASGPASVLEIPMENASPDRKYRMVAKVEGRVYSSDWMDALEPPVIDEVSIALDTITQKVEVRATLRGGDNSTGYVGISFDETWEFHSDFMCWYDYNRRTGMVEKRATAYPNYWCWMNKPSDGTMLVDFTQMTSDLIQSYLVKSFDRSDNRIQKRYSINVKAVTLPKMTYRYLKNLQYITHGGGSLFSPNPGEMASNVRCETDPSIRVFGYVTASKVASRRVFINDDYYIRPETSIASLFLPDVSNYRDVYDMGSRPIDYMSLPKGPLGQDISGVYWGPLRCIDCVSVGGTKEKPDFWE